MSTAATHQEHKSHAPKSIGCMVITCSDTRTPDTDTSGQAIHKLLRQFGHEVVSYHLIKDEPAQIKSRIEEGLKNDAVQAIIINGGTGISKRDSTFEAVDAMLEKRLVWTKVWAVACSVDHVREIGDFFEYRLGNYSVIVVRGDDGGLRAFQNVCLHRGNQLCEGSGTGLTEIRCGYHRWAWDLRGALHEVPSRRGFGVLDNDELGLIPASVDTWGPLVFVNLEAAAEPLHEYLEGVVQDSAWANLDEFHCVYSTTSAVESNWKVVADGFSETYHVQGIHPEMLASIDDVNTEQRIWDRHSVSKQRYGVASPRLRDRSDQAVWKSFVETQGERMGPAYKGQIATPRLTDGESIRDAIAARIRKHQATRGVDMSVYDTDGILRLSQYNLFPNTTVLVWGDMVNVLTSRPGPNPASAELTMYLLYRSPTGVEIEATAPRPMDMALPPDASLGVVIDQDLAMLKRFQNGLNQPGFTHLTLSSEECRIINMHRVLETYVGEKLP